MPSARVNPGVFEFRHKGRRGVWSPKGRLFHAGRNPATVSTTTGPTIAARIFVGFNVCDEPTWTMPDLVDLVKRIRKEQGRDPDASFVYQKGLYRHHPEPGHKDCGLVEEDSAQVIFIKIPEEYGGETMADFEIHMTDLAARLARDMKQESVILEFQKNGVTQSTSFVGWKEKA